MRPLLLVIIYLTVLCGAAISAGYFSLVLVDRYAAEIVEETRELGKKAYFANRASHFLWGTVGGTSIFVIGHIIGFCWLKGGLAHLRTEADPEDLIAGLWIHVGAAVVAALIGGVVGFLFG